MTTQSSYNMMRDPRMMVTVIVLFAVVAALAIWASIADPFGGAATRSASPSVADRREAVFATTEAQLAAEAKLPKGSALLPIKVTAAEMAAVEAEGGRLGKFVELLVSLGPWREVQVDRAGMPVLDGKPGDSLPFLFLARDGRVFAAAVPGFITDTSYLPEGVTAKVRSDGAVEVAAGGKMFLVRTGEAFFLEPPRLDPVGAEGSLYFYFEPLIVGENGWVYEAGPRPREAPCELAGCKTIVQPKKDVPPPVPIPTGTTRR